MAKEKFLILGASSFYGNAFATYVEEKGDEAIRLSRPEFDIEEPGTYGKVWEHADACIVNFISRSLVAESWDKPCDWAFTNFEALTGLVDFLNRKWKWRFIHVSTPEVYGNTRGWVSEKCHFNPSTPYAVSRAAADMMLMAYQRAYGFPAIITRTANIYGEGQKEPRIIPLAIRHKQEKMALPLHGGGTTVRSFIHVKDACEATYLICKEGTPGETYHISTRHAMPISELVKLIGCKVGEPIPDRLGKDRSYLMDSTKVRALGWTDKVRITDWIAQWATN